MKIYRTNRSHLPNLRIAYPNRVLLAVEDVAKILGFSKSHTYRLLAQRRLPFAMVNLSCRLQFSIVDVARYLDAQVKNGKAA
jgi:excisionase family DNA binding protein